jgi:hypothetical protein
MPVLDRRIREGASSPSDARELALRFPEHIENGPWSLISVNEALDGCVRARFPNFKWESS